MPARDTAWGMPEKNVELVRRLYASLDQGDDDAFWDLVAPEFVADFSRRLINPAVLRGRDQARAFAERERETWDQGQIDWEPEELIDAGDKVLAFIRTGGRGKGSGVRVDARVWNVWTFRDGRPVEWTYFGDDRALAFEAAGLEEQAMSGKNVEIARRGFDAFNRGDLDGTLETWAPDAVWDWSNSRGFDAGVFRGHDEIRAFAERFLEAFDEMRLELGDAMEVEDGLLILENVAYFRGRDGIETRAHSAWLVTIRDGEQTSLTLYQTKQEALEAAGLAEQDTHAGS
jgi:ketosteroid isomerase-like protein